jgi:hypothetical protein
MARVGGVLMLSWIFWAALVGAALRSASDVLEDFLEDNEEA